MKRGRIGTGVVIMAFALGLAGCGGQGPREFGKEDVEAINQMTRDFAAAYNAKDAEKVAMFFSGSAVIMPPNASTLRGFEPIRGYYVNRFAEGATDLVIEVREVNGHGPLAYVAGAYSFRNQPPDGPETRDRGKFLWITRNMLNQWKWEYQAWSSDLAPALPPPPEPADEAPTAKKK